MRRSVISTPTKQWLCQFGGSAAGRGKEMNGGPAARAAMAHGRSPVCLFTTGRQNAAGAGKILPVLLPLPVRDGCSGACDQNWHGHCIEAAGAPAKSNNGPGVTTFRGSGKLSEQLFGVHGQALALRSQRLALLASNIANAATPGYRARDIDFSRALQLASSGMSSGAAAENATLYRVPVMPSLNGNTVELSTEQTLFAENAVQYRATLSFLEGRINTIRRALKGE
jgi:flagellar basal-body rod protein FlgB